MKPETKKMYFPDKFCCLCMKKSDLKHLFDVDIDGVSHYHKLTSSIAEMNFKEMNDQRLICGECCVTLNTVYNFRQTCLRSKTKLITYLSQLQNYSHDHESHKSTISDTNKKIKCENEDSNCSEENSQLKEFQTKSYEDSIHFLALGKVECESEEEASSAHEDATADHVNERDVKMEDEPFIEYTAIDNSEDPLVVVKEEPLSDSETPQDGSTSQGTSGEPKESEGTAGLHKCEICKKVFVQKKNLINHKRIHSSERPYECEICRKSFTLKDYLSNHMKLHSTERPYECEICKKSFTMKNYLSNHMESNHSERLYECEVCKKNLSTKNALNKHMKLHSGEKYECEICKKIFASKYYLANHMESKHSGKLDCEICKKKLSSMYTLKKHMKLHSSGEYECKICGRSFMKKIYLNKHMVSHSKE